MYHTSTSLNYKDLTNDNYAAENMALTNILKMNTPRLFRGCICKHL